MNHFGRRDINPNAVQAMPGVDIDITRGRPALLTPEDIARADVVMTMGCGHACLPVFPGECYEDRTSRTRQDS